VKKLFILILLLTIGLTGTAFAGPAIVMDGQPVALSVNPLIENGRTLVPLRDISEQLDFAVAWDDSTRTVTASKDNIIVTLVIDGSAAKNGEEIALEVPAQIISDRTMVPLRFLSEAFNVVVRWDDASQTITLVSPAAANSIIVSDLTVSGSSLRVSGISTIDPAVSSYIQYYIGKEQPDTITACVFSSGIKTSPTGSFLLEIPVQNLPGPGSYQLLLEQNPKGGAGIPPEHWMAIFKDSAGALRFGDITSLGEIAGLIRTFGITMTEKSFTIPGEPAANDLLTIGQVEVQAETIVVRGSSKADPAKSTYIQYYVGKIVAGTITDCIYSSGATMAPDGSFAISIPRKRLFGDGNFQIILEQNPNTNQGIGPEHFIAFTKNADGTVSFGDITALGEIVNLIRTFGIQSAQTTVQVGAPAAADQTIRITTAEALNGGIKLQGTTTIDTKKSNSIRYYLGKEFPRTLSSCIGCDNFDVNPDGSFEAFIPAVKLLGAGTYTVVLEQNPNSNVILACPHWTAVSFGENGVQFGDISSMGEISNLAVTVGMKAAQVTVEVK